jgi:C1A family cysteine protease
MVWKGNLDYIRAHNAKNSTYTLAMNEHGDLTNDEFLTQFVGYTPIQRDYIRSVNTKMFSAQALPDSVDWVAQGKVNPIKDQGQCGSCWAFSAVGAIESAYAIEQNTSPISLSEQQLVDCSAAQGNQGCNGGLMDQAFEYVKSKGLTTESNYPYTAQDGTCNSAKAAQEAVVITGYTDVATNDETQLKAAVAQQPVSVAVEADGLDWQFYRSGVMSDACGTNLDHGVVAVGYGHDTASGLDYWKVRNSWGSSWGMSGYVLLKRGSTAGSAGECGIAMDPSYPTGAKRVSA